MKTKLFPKLLAAALAGLGLVSSSKADVTVVFSGGNASKNVLWQSASNILTGFSVVNGNSNTRSFTNGTLIGHPELGAVNIHFILNGAVGGIQDLQAQNNETAPTGAHLAPNIAVSSTAPEAVGIDPSPFTQTKTLVIPFVYVRNSKWTELSTITNLTQRQAVYLQSAAGALPTSYFGGTSANKIYFVGRDLAAAVRTEIDANVYFTGTLSSWTTNQNIFKTNTTLNAQSGNVYANAAIGALVPDPGTTYPGYPANTSLVNYGPGQPGGGQVNALLAAVTNSIGTVSSADISTSVTLSYEGVPFTPSNVANGIYPIWGYERWLYVTSGAATPSANQLTVINALLAQVTNNDFQHGNPPYDTNNQFIAGKFVALGDLNVERTADGGPITSTLY